MRELAETGAHSASVLLDSGHIAIAALLLALVISLVFSAVISTACYWMWRDNRELVRMMSELQESSITAFNELRQAVELLAERINHLGR